MALRSALPASIASLTKLRAPVVRIVCALLIVGLAFVAAQLCLNQLRGIQALSDSVVVNLCALALFVPLTYAAYRLYVQRVEHRPAAELSWHGSGWQLGLGFVSGLALFTAVIGCLWLLGVYQVGGANHWRVLIGALAGAVASAWVQELIFRGVLYRIVEETFGTWWALGLSSLIFGAAHLASPGSSALSTIAVLAAGALFAGAFMFTRQLWLAVAIHAAWDFANDGIFGVAVSGTSGHAIPGLLQASLHGPSALSGGPFGVEASLPAVVVVSLAATGLVWQAWRQRRQA